MLSTGISGSSTAPSSSQTCASRSAADAGVTPCGHHRVATTARPGRSAAGAASPPAGGRGARYGPRACRARHRRASGGRVSVASPRYFIDARRPTGRELRTSAGAMPARRHLHIDLVGGEQLISEAPQSIQRSLRALPALLGAVTEADQPAAAESVVVARLLQRLGGDSRQARIRGARQPLVRSPAARHRSATGARWSARSPRWAAPQGPDS